MFGQLVSRRICSNAVNGGGSSGASPGTGGGGSGGGAAARAQAGESSSSSNGSRVSSGEARVDKGALPLVSDTAQSVGGGAAAAGAATKGGKVREFFRKYGAVGISLYLGVYLSTLSALYGAIESDLVKAGMLPY